MKLDKLHRSITKAKKLSLDVFFSIKTHKPEMPLRVIVSERGTWQKVVAHFLQEKLAILNVEDPLLVKKSAEVTDFLKNVTYVHKNGVCIGSCLAPLLSDLFLAQCDRLLKARNYNSKDEQERKKFAVIPCVHQVSQNIKKIAERADVKVVFSAPQKLAKVCKMTNPNRKDKKTCTKNHKTKYVKCNEGLVYEIPLTCSRSYVGQTGRCMNDRLREHANNVKNKTEGCSSNLAQKR
ncbi:uncharacterized protein LOC119391559 [Rhipicephalus sanguineus]|uniref:uncharacterized protein LOC119391559 n=1 Tax=Rhipicephalus sanguineus TaxID=34632 RepID=UPI0020C59A3A|nr:uncharacterized protein LOC119391559 [Rhipicephalus sanguineus]